MYLTEFIESASQNVIQLQTKVEATKNYLERTPIEGIDLAKWTSDAKEIVDLWNRIRKAYDDLDYDYLDDFDFSGTFRDYSAEIIAMNGVCQAIEYHKALCYGDVSTVLEEVQNEEYPWGSVLEKMIDSIESGDFDYPFVKEDVNIRFNRTENDVEYPTLERALDRFENLGLSSRFNDALETIDYVDPSDFAVHHFNLLNHAISDVEELIQLTVDTIAEMKKALEELENEFGDDYENQVELNNIVFTLGYDYESDVKRLLKEQ